MRESRRHLLYLTRTPIQRMMVPLFQLSELIIFNWRVWNTAVTIATFQPYLSLFIHSYHLPNGNKMILEHVDSIFWEGCIKITNNQQSLINFMGIVSQILLPSGEQKVGLSILPSWKCGASWSYIRVSQPSDRIISRTIYIYIQLYTHIYIYIHIYIYDICVYNWLDNIISYLLYIHHMTWWV